jgi:plastocyanin
MRMTTTPTRWAPVTVVLLLLLLPLSAAAQSGGEVEVADSTFRPANLSIDAGGTVTWTQTSALPHTVTADDGSFDSHPDCAGGTGCMAAGDTFTHTFTEPGEYAYHCRIHGAPGGVGMAGVITVAAAGDEPADTEDPTDDGEGPTDGGEPDTTTEQPEAGAEVTGSLTVADQSGDGTRITVAQATITGADGFVVVHADADGAPGPVIGHAPLPEGTSRGLVVLLDEPLTGNATVWPMLHVDAGEPGVYEFPGPDVPVTVDGEVVVASLAFTLAAAGESTAADSLPLTGAPLVWLAAAALAAVTMGAVAVRRRSG